MDVQVSEEEVDKRDIKLLETVEDIENRREQVLRRYADFKYATQDRRKRLEDAKKLFQFKRDSDEVELWIHDKLLVASDECYKDQANLQVSFGEAFFYANYCILLTIKSNIFLQYETSKTITREITNNILYIHINLHTILHLMFTKATTLIRGMFNFLMCSLKPIDIIYHHLVPAQLFQIGIFIYLF